MHAGFDAMVYILTFRPATLGASPFGRAAGTILFPYGDSGRSIHLGAEESRE